MSESDQRGTAHPGVPESTGNLLGLRDADAEDLESADVVLFGVPTNEGTDGRRGAAQGPAETRAASWTFGSYNMAHGVDILECLTVVDGGDLDCDGVALDGVCDRLQERVVQLISGGQVTGFVGGTQALTLGALRGIVQAKRRPVRLVHLTATHGLREDGRGEWGMLRRALDEGLLKSRGVFQVGIRGPADDSAEQQEAYGAGFERLSVDDVRWDIHGAMEAIRNVAVGSPIYVSVDLGALDPSACPGVTRPVPGGLSSWETQQVLRSLVGADIVGFDVVGLCPAWDVSQTTAMMGVNVIHEILAAVVDTREASRVSLIGGSIGRTSA